MLPLTLPSPSLVYKSVTCCTEVAQMWCKRCCLSKNIGGIFSLVLCLYKNNEMQSILQPLVDEFKKEKNNKQKRLKQ